MADTNDVSGTNSIKLRHSKLITRTPSPKQRVTDRYKPQIKLLRNQIKTAIRVRNTASPTAREQINNRLMDTRNKIRGLQIQMDRQLMSIPQNQKMRKTSKPQKPPQTEKKE